ncbi:MAG: hypothetical protein CMF49_06160 [Legionellales bacterium]|nr:hypothetical protein [Legionellales bacterium]|tara:strand:- start:1619 stop:2143 length:525 start_codon:yes stop_codon:yes gene_type:complete
MSINAQHLYDLVIMPALNELAEARTVLGSRIAKKLVLATACHESACGTYLRQINNDGHYSVARGIFQVEPPTHQWIFNKLMTDDWRDIREKVFNTAYPTLDDDRLIYDLNYAAKICRLRYYLAPAALPESDDLFHLANYWGKYYQTQDKDLNHLSEKEKTFIAHCKKYGGEIFR